MTAPDASLPPPTPAGLLLVDKAEDFTSMDVCAIIRTRLRRAGAPRRIKVGHGGTLDPKATGLLVVLVGKATRLCEQIMVGEKHYLAHVDLSATSASFDRGSPRVDVAVAHPPARDAVQAILPRFTGVIQQRPPAFSALNVGGRRAYELAREGAPPDLPPRPVVIHELTILDYAFPILTLHVRCGKGTYIRSLARDLGEALGTGGMLHALRRTRVGAFSIDSARTLDAIPQRLTQADLLPLPPSPSDQTPS